MIRHPSPADIRYHISRALSSDPELEGKLPAKTMRVINDAISRACDEANEKEQTQ